MFTNLLHTYLQIIALLLCFSAFTVAADRLPTNPRLLFNHGAELAASGKLDEATEILRQVAVVQDRTIAAKALSLLGQIAAASAKPNIAENPVETPPEQRKAIFEHLKSAEQSFAESLSLQPNEEIRQYLETLRAWRHNMANTWEKYDREQLRNAELQQRIQQLADWEEKLMEKVRPTLEEPDSPRKFQTEYETSREQKQLAEELAVLQKEPVDDEELREKWERFPEIQKTAEESAELLAKHHTEEALTKQQEVLDYLRSLLKQEQNQQNQEQDQENQEQNNQDQQQQNQQSQPEEPKDNKDNMRQREQEVNQPQASEQTQEESAQKKNEDAKEKAERMLMQVRRKEQAAEKRREQLRALQMQAEPVEKDW